MLAAAIIAVLLAMPGRMPPLSKASSCDYGAKTNPITSFDDNPPFKGVVVLEDLGCPDLHRNRIRRYFHDDNDKLLAASSQQPTITSSTSTTNILSAIVTHLACNDAPVDTKEVAESIEFYLRSGKRAIGAAKRTLQNMEASNNRWLLRTYVVGMV
jgi:hypothetical protein